MDKKQLLWIGAGIVVAGGAIMFFNKWEQNQQQNASDESANDAELAQLMLEQPLSYASGETESASVSGPTVDTGSSNLQSLIASVINPASNTTDSSTQTTTNTTSNTAITQQESAQEENNLPNSTYLPTPVIDGNIHTSPGYRIEPVPARMIN